LLDDKTHDRKGSPILAPTYALMLGFIVTTKCTFESPLESKEKKEKRKLGQIEQNSKTQNEGVSEDEDARNRLKNG
jgi:hypothetical protein